MLQWYYSGEQGKQTGPIPEANLVELVREGRIGRTTLVWNDALPEWVPLASTPLARFAPETSEPVPPPATPPTAPSTTPGSRWVVARNPPHSPHWAWLNLFFPGTAHLILGQIGKGVLLLVLMPCIWVAFWSAGIGVVILLLTAVDAFLVGRALQAGKPVGRWQCFPL